MNGKARYVIEGRLCSAEDVSFDGEALAVHGFVAGKEVGAASVNKAGAYKLVFESGSATPNVELRLVPAKPGIEAAQFPGLVEKVSPLRFEPVDQGSTQHAHIDIHVSKQLMLDLHWATRSYHIHGAVYAYHMIYLPGMPPMPVMLKRPLPAARLDFYEANQVRFWFVGKPQPPPTERFLGTAYTAQGGGYDFTFDFTTNILSALLFGDGKPDIKVRISQFRDGAWSQVYEGTTDWDISEDFVKNYLVPEADVYFPPEGQALLTGFRPVALGLLPLDGTRVVDGYGTSADGDPVPLVHQPFCETLRIFGLFGTSDTVPYYKVEVTPATKDPGTGNWVSASGQWEDVMDPLNNQQWNDVKKRWDWRVLGPTPDTHLYQNIDHDPEADWFEHGLKLTWNSANKPDGYYLLKIVPCDPTGNQLSAPLEYQVPVLRIDNTLPQASLEVKSPSPSDCGVLPVLPVDPADSSKRLLTFSVTAHSAAGHILRYTLNGERGLHDLSAGTTIEQDRPADTPTWTGALDQDVVFKIDSNANGCPVVAYNFELMVQGSATNCYSAELESRRVWRETNLVGQE